MYNIIAVCSLQNRVPFPRYLLLVVKKERSLRRDLLTLTGTVLHSFYKALDSNVLVQGR